MSTIWFTFIFAVHIACVVCSEENKDGQTIGKLAPQEVDNRVFKGKATRIKNIPYQVLVTGIFRNQDEMFMSTCGGAILRPKIIITAAHCVINKDVIKVKAGSSFTDHGGVTRKVAQIIVHESFKREYLPTQSKTSRHISSIDYDVALLKLSESLKYSETIKNVKIPEPNDRLAPGKYGTVAGWGFIFGTTLPTVLQKTLLPVMTNDQCKRIATMQVTSRMFCAGFFKTDTSNICKGDSGSPFVANNKIYGIASAIRTKCTGNPSITVFTDISSVHSWITTKLNQLS